MILSVIHKLKSHIKLILQLMLGLLSILAAIYFIKHEQTELIQVKSVLSNANSWLVVIGLLSVLLFVLVQGWMYQYSFKAVRKRIPLKTALLLFLKRNFISVFIPVSTITNIFFFNKDIEKKQGIDKTYIYYASIIFSLCSIASSILIAIPAAILLLMKNNLRGNYIIGIVLVVLILVGLIYGAISVVQKGFVFKILQKRAPQIALSFEELLTHPLDKIALFKVLALSCIIEIIGLAQLYIAMMALNITPSITVAIVGYSLVLIILMTSPLLKGVGAIELALTYVLTLFGFAAVGALSVAFLFRFFEFWSVLVLGALAFLFKKDGLFIQLLAPVLLFFLGVINILSAITPALVVRMKYLVHFIPQNIIEVSNTMVVVVGIILIFTAVTLVQGYRNSYYLALSLTVFSIIGHLFKGIDYEEATLSLITASVLVYQRKDYFIRSTPFKFPKLELAVAVFIGVLIYGIGGFYLLDFRHFNENFTLWNSVKTTFQSIALLNIQLNAITPFARYFLLSLNILGISSLIYLFWVGFKTFNTEDATNKAQFKSAKQMVLDFGRSSLDYFKTYPDKLLYFFENNDGFISFKTTRKYAVVLENPVCFDDSPENLILHIKEFESFALSNNRNVIYYRVPDTFRNIYESMGKKLFLLGEDASVNLKSFTLEGLDAKPLRNAINKMIKSGFIFKMNQAPQSDGFLQQLAFVSNDWLRKSERKEFCFSQGTFNTIELKQQTVLTVENEEGKIVAFLNVIPSIKGELNFDLMRKTADAPNGTMDFLFISMMQHYKDKGYNSLNLGMVPFSGIDDPQNFPERAMKLAYEKLKQFGHYKSLRSFKEKFKPDWIKLYVVYDNDMDLINLPTILKKVMTDCT
ncbi:MAG: phosphatidylglycerol lysyltransferase domain-containing protein [Candidatus Saccharimonadaceae bacterium]